MENGVIIAIELVGIMILIIGIVIWKKQKISLMHSYHYKNVAKEDVPMYTKWQGIALVLMGLATMAMGILLTFNFETIGIIQLIIIYILSLVIIIKTQLKYNGGIF